MLLQLCYAVQPSRTVARPLVSALAKGRQAERMQLAYSKAMAQANFTVRRMSWVQHRAPGIDAARLTTSLAESLCLRAAMKPATFVFKLWASYNIVLLAKHRPHGGSRGQEGRRQGGH